jgi:predicted  nucleic acid-binding Zn-ribbon protein
LQKDLSMLLDLQEIDDQLGELERSKIYLPEMILNLEKEIDELNQAIAMNNKILEESQREQHLVELEIETDKTDLDKYQKQMRVIKTNKEYDALTAEIDIKKQGITDKEERILALMAAIDEAREKATELGNTLKEVQIRNSEQLDMLRNQASTLQAKIEDKLEKRVLLVKDINRQIVGVYERIRKGKGGMAVVPIRKRACSGCFKQIPPQRIQEIRRGDRIFACDNCGRILTWTDEESA